MKPTIKYVVLTALRDRLLTSLLIVLLMAFGIAAFMGSTAVAESREMTAVYAAGASRVILVLGLTVFVAFHVEKLHESREIEALLSRAISRETLVFSYWVGVAAVAVLIVGVLSAAVIYISPSRVGAMFWCATLLMESLIIIAFALASALIMERAIPAIFATCAFYALGRLVGFFLSIAVHGRQSGGNSVANPIFEGIALMIPRLDLMGQTRWIVYGLDQAAISIILPVQCLVYSALLLLTAMFDLRRKHF